MVSNLVCGLANVSSQYFECSAGVRRDAFSVQYYLVSLFMSSGQMGIQLTQDMCDLFDLLYAGDLVIFADSRIRNLQRLIDILSAFCTKWRMEVNLDKTKVMIFRKGGHPFRLEKWYFRGEMLEIVSYYKYLGLLLSSRNT